MKTAVIGLGNIGGQVASLLIAGGQDVLLVDHSDSKVQALVKGSSGKAKASTLPAAIEGADVIILAVAFDAIKPLLVEYRDKLKYKVVVDPSNPIEPDGKGGFKKSIPQDQSSGEILSGLLSPDTKFVKAFGSLAAPSLKSGANRSPKRAVLFYATDFEAAGKSVAELIKTAGFAPISVGGIHQSIRIEVFGDLHEMGKLGKLVSEDEAKKLI
jgi:predicted dinucleotide-binding enzyme